jgi:hypothetical protein
MTASKNSKRGKLGNIKTQNLLPARSAGKDNTITRNFGKKVSHVSVDDVLRKSNTSDMK